MNDQLEKYEDLLLATQWLKALGNPSVETLSVSEAVKFA